jgi:predicted ATPase
VILATSRTVLGLRAEREYPVPPLPLPADPATIPADMLLSELAASPAVALFTDRARALRPDFAVTVRNAAAVAEICRRLEGLPLAIELAAARTRLLDPAALLERLEASLDALGTGTVDMPERQRTLRATVEWSVGLLSDAERSLLEAAAIFVDSWTVEAAAGVAADTQERALELAEALVRHSLLYTENVGDGPRLRMLDTVREFVSERLAARPDVAQIERRHAHYYRELAEQAGRPLRTAEQSQWLRRLQPEVGNLGVAVRWYLTHDRMQLPHMFRLLLPFVVQADDILADALSWIDQLLPDADAMDLQAQAELLLPTVLIKNQTGDGAGALADGQRLEALLTELDDPYLHAASLLVVAWTLPISGDLDAGISKALAALEEFRPLDEPYWMTAGLLSTGYMEREAGRYDDAERHLRNSHEMAVRFDYSWMAAGSQLQLGSLAVEQGHMEQARTLLDESLAASLARYSTPNVILGLAAYARLAFAGGDPERAALLAGASEGLRKRAGLGIWADPQRGEADFAAQIRGAIGAHRFPRAYRGGFRHTRRDAVPAARGRPAAASDESGG